MCRMHFVGAFVRLLLLVVAVALTFCMPNVLVGLAVWPLVWLTWERLAPEERRHTPSVFDVLIFLPYAIGVQGALDSLVPYAGDVAVLVGNAMIITALRRPKIPRATLIARRER